MMSNVSTLPAPPHTRPSRTVLVVDDDEVVTQQFALVLRRAGYKVLTALDGASGLHAAATGLPDAIILDLHMPVSDGLAFLRQVRAHEAHRDTPVAIVTGDYFIDDTVCAELRALGADLRFKPLWLEDLIAIVTAMFSGAAERGRHRFAAVSLSGGPNHRDRATGTASSG
jgi:two-component system response regulator MprA